MLKTFATFCKRLVPNCLVSRLDLRTFKSRSRLDFLLKVSVSHRQCLVSISVSKILAKTPAPKQGKGPQEKTIPQFIKKDEWSPQSLDSNPMDYAISVTPKEKFHQGLRDNLNKQAMKDRIITSWKKILMEEIKHF